MEWGGENAMIIPRRRNGLFITMICYKGTRILIVG
jgi:hypothetical protein